MSQPPTSWEVGEIRAYLDELQDTPVPSIVPVEYMLGLWCEAEFNGRRGLGIGVGDIHRIAREWCAENRISDRVTDLLAGDSR